MSFLTVLNPHQPLISLKKKIKTPIHLKHGSEFKLIQLLEFLIVE